jgi:hypothetical protein
MIDHDAGWVAGLAHSRDDAAGHDVSTMANRQ